MSKNRFISPTQLIDRVGIENVMEGIFSGELPSHIALTLEHAKSFSENLRNALVDQKSEDDNVKPLRANYTGEIYVACIEDPIQNIKYYTLMDGGKLELTLSARGAFDVESLKEQGLIGYHTLEDVFADVFETSSLPSSQRKVRTQRKITSSRGKSAKKKRILPRAKVRQQFIIDPALKEYLREKEPFLTAQVFGKTPQSRAHQINTLEELAEYMGKDQVEKFSERGFKATLQTSVDFVVANKRKIQRSRKRRLDALLNNAEVRHCVREYIHKELKGKDNIISALEFLEKSSNVRQGYAYFSNDKNRLDDVSVEEIIDVLRSVAIESVGNNRERVDRINRSMQHWISVAKAARFVEHDERLKRVIPLFEEARGTEIEGSISAKVYEGMRKLATYLLNRELHYSVGELPFIVDGLWLKGYFTKRNKIENQEEEEKKEIDRELRGVRTQFVHPVSHLMKRFERYDPILKAALNEMIQQGKISPPIKLNSQAEDINFGVELYNAIPEDIATKTFTRLYGDDEVQLAAPRSIGGGGRTSEWVLGYYVGTRREKITEAIKKGKKA